MTFAPAVGEERALQTLATALAGAPADHVEGFLTARRGDYTRFAGARVHQPQAITEVQVMIRAEVAGRVARAATSNPAEVAEVVQLVCRSARDQASNGGPVAGSRAPAAGGTAELSLWGDDTAAWDVGRHVELASAAMRWARSAGGVAAGMFGRAVTELAMLSGDGQVRRYASATEASGALTVRVDDGSSCWKDVSRQVSRIGVEAAVERTVAEAVATRNRTELPDGSYDVVLGPTATAELLDFFGAFGFTGSAAVAGIGVPSTRAGELVASALVDISDDATADVGLPFPFDFEGTPKRRVALLDAGRVGGVVTDRETAARLGVTPTGHFHIAREEPPRAIPMNLVMAAGGTSEDDLIAGVERGVYVQRFWYTRVVDPVATTITGVSRDACFRIENGRLGRPVSGARFTESVLGVLSRVDAVGDGVLSQPLMNVWNGAASAPAVRVRGFRFGAAPEVTR